MMLDSETTKTYTRPISKAWWLRDRGHFNRRYFMFLIRELTSVFVALYVVLFIYELFLLTKGPDAHAAFQESLRSGPFIVFFSHRPALRPVPQLDLVGANDQNAGRWTWTR